MAKCIKVVNGYVLASEVVAVHDDVRRDGGGAYSPTGKCFVSVRSVVNGDWHENGGSADSSFTANGCAAEIAELLGWEMLG